MGCNIHGFIEVLEYPDSKSWFSVHEIPYTRNYRFYAVIAGVRNYIEINPISKAKGLPTDVGMMSSVESKEMGSDGHTHSWLTYKELKEYDWLQDVGGSMLIDNIHIHFKSMLNEMRFLSSTYGEEKVRVVFWFDN